jgi:hypothetical protein
MIHMMNSSGLHYTGSIPSQLSGSVVQYYLYAADRSGHNAVMPFMGPSDPFTFTALYPVIIDNSGNTNSLQLSNSPNPFSSSTVIHYRLPERGQVRLEILDPMGKRVAVLIHEVKEAGSGTMVFDGRSLQPGMYCLRFICGKGIVTRKMMVVR